MFLKRKIRTVLLIHSAKYFPILVTKVSKYSCNTRKTSAIVCYIKPKVTRFEVKGIANVLGKIS